MDRDCIFHNGGIDGFLTHFVRYPKQQLTIIVLSNLQTASIPKIEQDLAAIFFSEPYKLPKQRKAISLEPAILEKYVGQYKFASSPSLPPEVNERVFAVTTDSQRIFAQLTGQKTHEIFPESPTKFFYKVVDAQLTFVTNNEGEPQVIIHQHGKDSVLNKID